MSEPHIISFSFGQTSGFMLSRLMDQYGAAFDKRFRVVFENTGKEHDATLEFGHEFETKRGIPITWLEYTRVPAVSIPLYAVTEGKQRTNLAKQQAEGLDTHWFKVVDYHTARRDTDPNTPFDELLSWANVLPNTVTRMCSVQMKIRTRDRYLRSIGVMQFNSYIGIRADESDRINDILANVDKYETPHFPLNDAGVTVKDVKNFWDKQPFRLNIPNYLGNCKQCWLKKRSKLLRIAKEDRASIEWGAMQEKRFALKGAGAGAFFKEGQSYEGILHEADNQTIMQFADDGGEVNDTPCSCAIGGYRGKTDED